MYKKGDIMDETEWTLLTKLNDSWVDSVLESTLRFSVKTI